ncbi:MAG: D-tyrosyl-tRNA(Tyr) deacylase [Phascolarctobacterium sp.]|nr:D-tyrosyl-tRNA(Tyr) deacylase [Phascolarctobacterium sp.]
MRAVVQRVDRAKVMVDGKIIGKIQKGLLVFLGVVDGDTEIDLEYMVEKIIGLRIFADDAEKMNFSVVDINGEILVVPQFTLCADCRKGKRPSFDKAALPKTASDLYEKFIIMCRKRSIHVEIGIFKAHMLVDLVNNGPVTILLDSRKAF